MENLADLVGEATNFLADYNLFPITPNTSFFGHVSNLLAAPKTRTEFLDMDQEF